jgi:hypothetical protein
MPVFLPIPVGSGQMATDIRIESGSESHGRT